MNKQITFDCSLGLQDFEADLKRAEADIKNAKKRLEKADRDYNYNREKNYRANKVGDEKGAEKYARAMATAEEASAKAQYDLSEAEVRAGEASKNIQESASNMSLLGKMTQGAGSIMDMLKKKVVQLGKRILIFSVLMKAIRAIRSYFGEVLQNNEQFAQSLGRLKGAMQTMVAPLIELLVPVLTAIVNWLTKVITAFAQLIGMLTGKGLNAMKKFAKEATQDKSSQFASFDTINQLGGGNDNSDMQANFEFAELTQTELTGILTTIGLIASALLALKFPVEGLSFLENLLGILLLIGGAVIAVKNYFDAWTNGLNKDNLAGIIGGIAMALGGLYILFGTTGVAIGAIVAGISLLVLGFKDIIDNGVNLTNVLSVIAGIFLAGLGISILIGSWIPLLVAGIAGIVFALVAVGGQAEALIKGIKDIFNGLITFITGVFTGDWAKAWEGLKQVFKGIWNSILAIVGGVLNAIIKGINWVIDKMNTLQFDIPDWVPIIGGKHVGLSIPHIAEWNVPYLAQGAVIPPNREFLAVLGDQTNGTNIEAPLDTIVSAVQQALGGMDTNVNVHFNGSLAQIAKVLQPEISAETKRRGSSFVSIGGTVR